MRQHWSDYDPEPLSCADWAMIVLVGLAHIIWLIGTIF